MYQFDFNLNILPLHFFHTVLLVMIIINRPLIIINLDVQFRSQMDYFYSLFS